MSQWPLAEESNQLPKPSRLHPSGRNSSSSHNATRRNSTTSFQAEEGLFAGMAVDTVDMLKAEVMVNYLYVKQQENVWTTHTLNEGVVLKQARNSWISFPPELSAFPGSLYEAVARMNVKVKFYISERSTES